MIIIQYEILLKAEQLGFVKFQLSSRKGEMDFLSKAAMRISSPLRLKGGVEQRPN